MEYNVLPEFRIIKNIFEHEDGYMVITVAVEKKKSASLWVREPYFTRIKEFTSYVLPPSKFSKFFGATYKNRCEKALRENVVKAERFVDRMIEGIKIAEGLRDDG